MSKHINSKNVSLEPSMLKNSLMKSVSLTLLLSLMETYAFLKLPFFFIFRMYVSCCLLLLFLANALFQFQYSVKQKGNLFWMNECNDIFLKSWVFSFVSASFMNWGNPEKCLRISVLWFTHELKTYYPGICLSKSGLKFEGVQSDSCL